MIVICEECGRKYNVNPDRIKNDKVWVTCKKCLHRFYVVKPPGAAPEVASETIQAFIDSVPVEEYVDATEASKSGRSPRLAKSYFTPLPMPTIKTRGKPGIR